jgi:hypothetical protein
MIIIPFNSLPSWRVALTLLLLVCGSRVAAADYEYSVRVDASLDTLHVVGRFAAEVDAVRARHSTAQRFLLDATDCTTGRPLERRNRELSASHGSLSCIDYVVDLRRAAAAERRNDGLAPDNVVASPAVWLWLPTGNAGSRVIVRFLPDEGVRVSVPWHEIAGHEFSFEIPPSPHAARAPAAFGHFAQVSGVACEGLPRIALLRSGDDGDGDAIIEWVRAAARNASLAYGRFPNPGAQVLVLPVDSNGWHGDSPVPFGRVVRDGGETVELFINSGRPIPDFYDDWTATHEFSHLMLPFLRPAQRWISEGFAQYYQNVLLARAGQYDLQRAWQKLYEGFERGRNSQPDLSPNAASRRGVGAATMKIYWSGAILALMADVELRQRSAGRESLDDVLDRLQRCCLPATERWSGPRLFAKLDSLIDEPLFMPLYRRYADAAGFPDYAPLFRRLGVAIEDGRVELHDNAELADVRKAITRSPAPPTDSCRRPGTASARSAS